MDMSDHDRREGPQPEDLESQLEPREVVSFQAGGPLTPQEVAGSARPRPEVNAQFVPPPGPPPVSFEPREGAPFDVSGNGHQGAPSDESSQARPLADWASEDAGDD